MSQTRWFPGYEIITRIFRPAVPADHPNANWNPGDPHTLWRSITPSPGPRFPLHEMFEAQPQFTGRLIHFPTGWPQRETQSFAMVSLRHMIHRIPPHPGLRPSELDEFAHPYYILSDGTWGPYQAARYPQEFDHRRPWQGFHLFPDRRPHCPMEQLNPTEFFEFRGLQENMTGGAWNISRLRTLLFHRQEQELAFLAALRAIGDPQGDALQEHFGQALPFVDNLDEDIAATWRTWSAGRDAVGHTLRYVGELGAMIRWLAEVKRQRSEGGPAVISTDLMGSWVGAIERKEDWEFLHSSPLPLYGLYQLLPDHPLHAMTALGTLDNDEFYRTDALLSNLRDIPDSYSSDYPYGCQQRPISAPFPVSFPCTRTGLPHGVQVTPPKGHQVFPVPISWMHPFTSYLFLDPKIQRHTSLPAKAMVEKKGISKRLMRIAASCKMPILPPFAKDSANQRLPFHPIVQFLPHRHPGDFKERAFVEEQDHGFFWPTRVSNPEKKRYRDFDNYKYEHKIGSNDILFSDYPWPLINDMDPTGNLEEEDEVEAQAVRLVPGANRRAYLSKPPSQKLLDKALPYRCLPPPALERQWINEGVGSRMGGNPVCPVSTHENPRQLPVLSYDLGDDDDDELDYTAPSSKHIAPTIVHPPPGFASPSQWSGQRSIPSRPPSYSFILFATACAIISHSASDRTHLARRSPSPPPDGEQRHRGNHSRSRSPRSRRRSEPSRDLDLSSSTPQIDSQDGESRHSSQPRRPRSETRYCLEESMPITHIDLPGTEVEMEAVLDSNALDSAMEQSSSNDVLMTDVAAETAQASLEPTTAVEELPMSMEAPSSSQSIANDRAESDAPNNVSIPDPLNEELISPSGPSLDASNDLASPGSISLLSVGEHGVPPSSSSSMDSEFTSRSVSPSECSAPPATPTPSRHATPTPSLPSPRPPRFNMSMIEQIVDTAREGRRLSHAYIVHRLNHSRRESNLVDTVHKCKFYDENTSIICYPLRISNVDVGVVKPLDVIGAFRHMASGEQWGDIAMISLVHEADMTLTIDVGFTDLEDALAMWSKNGRKFKDRHWDIQPISGVLGLCYIFRDPTPLQPLSWRLQRLSACEAWMQAVCPNDPDGPLITQLRSTISQLAVANGLSHIPATHLPRGASLEDLFDGSHLRQSPWALSLSTRLDQPVLDRMYFKIKATRAQWSSTSTHNLRFRSYHRRDVYNRPEPPEIKERSKAFKRHEKEKQKIQDQAPPDMENPAASREMTGRERGFARRSTQLAAKTKHDAWSSPRLVLPPVPEKVQGQSLVDEFVSIWEWYEACSAVIQRVASAVGINTVPKDVQNPATLVVQQSFLAASLSFGPGERFQKLFGSEYTEVMKRVVKLRDSVSDGSTSDAVSDPGDADGKEWDIISEGTAASDGGWLKIDSEMLV